MLTIIDLQHWGQNQIAHNTQLLCYLAATWLLPGCITVTRSPAPTITNYPLPLCCTCPASAYYTKSSCLLLLPAAAAVHHLAAAAAASLSHLVD
jgi:hypothetical protein